MGALLAAEGPQRSEGAAAGGSSTGAGHAEVSGGEFPLPLACEGACGSATLGLQGGLQGRCSSALPLRIRAAHWGAGVD